MLTLIEAAKALATTETVRQAIIELFAFNSNVLEFLPFEDIQGSALKYNAEAEYPGVAFRGVNESYTESTGVLNPQVEALYIAGGDLDVDTFILQTMGEGRRAVEEAMKVKALAYYITYIFIKGDSTIDPRQFDGLQKRITGTQLVHAGAASGGNALSLAKLDELIDQVEGCTHLIMNKTMRRLLTAAARTPAVSGYVTYTQDSFGRRITKYNDIPILVLDKDNLGNQILPFSEANPTGGGTPASTSIYAVRMGSDGLVGLQSGTMQVRDLGELQTKPAKRTRVEWFMGMAIFSGYAAARLDGIKNAAVTA